MLSNEPLCAWSPILETHRISLFPMQLGTVINMLLKSEKILLKSFIWILCSSLYSFYLCLASTNRLFLHPFSEILFSVQCAVRTGFKGYTKDNSQLLLIYIHNFDEQLCIDYSEDKSSSSLQQGTCTYECTAMNVFTRPTWDQARQDPRKATPSWEYTGN